MIPLNSFKMLAAAVAILGAVPTAFAEGDPMPTYQRERAMQKYKSCKFTDEMGKYLYECVKKNNGFGTHWCFDEALEVHCPAPTAQNSVPSGDAPAAKTQ